MHPHTHKPIGVGAGPHGPYVRTGKTFASLEAGDDLSTVTLERALDLLSVAQESLRVLGIHPNTGKDITVKACPHGPYVRHEWTLAFLKGRQSPDSLTLDEAVALVDAEVSQA